MDDIRLARIERKLDKIDDRLTAMEVSMAKQEWNIIKKLGSIISGVIAVAIAIYKIRG